MVRVGAAHVLVAFLVVLSSQVNGQNIPGNNTTPRLQPASFVVHEWGTFTTLAGSDGVLLPGLYREEEYLPYFVHCFSGFSDGGYIHKGLSLICDSVTLKMETPVLYFYSDTARSVDVRVNWPGGTISQWYPNRTNGEVLPQDYYGHLDFSTPHNGWIEWTANILAHAPDDTTGISKDGETHTWQAPRATDANVVTDSLGEVEKFLFYRGVGNANFMDGAVDGHYVLKTYFHDNKLIIKNRTQYNIAYAMVFERAVDEVTGDSVNRVWWSGPVGNSQTVTCAAPGAVPLFSFATELSVFRDKLVASGLYQKEADAMIDTWQQSYFGTPGLRIFWIVPRASTDASLPLSITPSPDSVARVLVARSEVLTPQFEQKILTDFQNGTGNYYGDRYFLAYQARVQALEAQASVGVSTDGTSEPMIAPNPSPGTFMIFGLPLHTSNVTVTNVLGETVLSVVNPKAGMLTLDLSQCPSQTYFLRIATTTGVILRQIAKE